MEKNTLLAVVLSIAVLVGFYFIQGIFFPPKQAAPSVVAPAPTEAAPPEVPEMSGLIPPEATPPKEATPAEQAAITDTVKDGGPAYEERVTVQTDILTVVLSSAGGDAVSWKLKGHRDNKDSDEPVNMILSGDKEAHAFTVAFGGLNAQPVTSFFYVNRISDYTVEFYRDFIIPNSDNAKFRQIGRAHV
jgi:YidC/Oxa1 family membrane protein insertase